MPLFSPSAATRTRLALSLAAGLSIGVAALAADKPRNAPVAAKKPDAVLTPAQLRDCMAQKERLQKDTDAALKVKADIATDKAEIDRSGNALGETAATLDRTSADAVAAYNAKVEERDKLIESYKGKIDSYNKDAEAVLATKDAYAKACENRRYDDRDLSDLQKKK